MAAETAKLIAALTLKDGFTGPLKSASGALNKFDSQITSTQGRAYKAGTQIGVGIKRAAVLAVAGIGTVATSLIVLAKEGQDAANVQKLYADAVARSGKVSASQVAALNAQQTAIMNLTGADDELIKTEQTRLINMGLTGAQIQTLIPLIQDAAAATGKDVESITTAVGKAVLGNAGALQKLGIIIPKTTAATKSAALVALERQKAELAVAKSLDASHGALTKHEKAVYAEKAAALDAAIGQQKLTDAQKTGAKTADNMTTVTNALSKSFSGAAAATSGSLDTRLKVLNENLKNVREEAGQKLLPAMTRIVDVVGSKLVPAFGKFVDAVLPTAIAGLDKLASFLEGGGATSALDSLLNTAKTVAPILQKSAEATLTVVQTAVSLFSSLPPEIQSLAVAGLAINKLTGGLVTNIAGGLISAVISSFKGLMNVNAAVVNVNGPVGGVGGALPAAAGAGGGLAGLLGIASTFAIPVTVAAIGTKALTDWTNASFQGIGIPTNFAAPGSTGDNPLLAALPFGTGGAIQSLVEAIKAFTHQPLPAAVTADERPRGTAGDPVHTATDLAAPLAKLGAVLGGTGAAAHAKPKLTAAEIKATIAADRAARGIKDTGPSTSLAPRLNFLAGNASGGRDVKVGDAIALGFERGATPLFRDTKLIPTAIKALQKDQHQLLAHGDTKAAGLIGRDIERLKAELKRRTDAGAAKTAAAARAAGIQTAAAIRDKELSAQITVINRNTWSINGRQFASDAGRFQTTVLPGTK